MSYGEQSNPELRLIITRSRQLKYADSRGSDIMRILYFS